MSTMPSSLAALSRAGTTPPTRRADAVDAPRARVWARPLVGAIDPEDYYDFQVNRPDACARSTAARRHQLADRRGLAVARRRSGTGDVVLVRGIEPNMRWRASATSCSACLRGARRRPRSSPSGALLADVPHTRPVEVTGICGRRRTCGDRLARPSRTRARRASSACSTRPCSAAGMPVGLVLGRGAALRRAAAVPEGDAGPARAASRTCSTSPSRSATCPRRPAPGSAASTSWPARTATSRSTSRRSSSSGHRRSPRGQRRGDRAGVRALPPPRATDCGPG